MTQVNQIEADEVLEIFNKKDESIFFIDVRDPEELEQGTIPNINKISWNEFPQYIESLDKNKKYIIVCNTGAKSNRGAETMLKQGFSDVSSFSGGMLSWYENDYPLA